MPRICLPARKGCTRTNRMLAEAAVPSELPPVGRKGLVFSELWPIAIASTQIMLTIVGDGCGETNSTRTVSPSTPRNSNGEIMTHVAKSQSFMSTFAAATAVFFISVALGAGASQALVTTSARVVNNKATGQPIAFADARRLPQTDDVGAPVQPLFAYATQAKAMLDVSR